LPEVNNNKNNSNKKDESDPKVRGGGWGWIVKMFTCSGMQSLKLFFHLSLNKNNTDNFCLLAALKECRRAMFPFVETLVPWYLDNSPTDHTTCFLLGLEKNNSKKHTKKNTEPD